MSRRFLRSVVARILRAEEHLSELRPFFDVLREEYPDASVESDLVTGAATDVIGIELSVPLPSILIGEIVYNLRAALDYLVYALARLDSGGPQEGTQFPIDDEPKDFAGHRNSFLKGVNDAHVARIKELQPFSGCDWTKRLRFLSNPDKHRHLTRLLERGTFHYRRLKTGVHPIDEADRDTPRPDEMYVEVARTREITFPDGTPIIDTLEELKAQVRKALLSFEPDFGP